MTKYAIFTFLLLLTAPLTPADLTKVVSARTISVTNGSQTDILCPLPGARMVQVFIPPSGTDQVYTITLEDTTTVEIPSGGIFTLRSKQKMKASDRVFQIQTATGTTDLQVIGMSELD